MFSFKTNFEQEVQFDGLKSRVKRSHLGGLDPRLGHSWQHAQQGQVVCGSALRDLDLRHLLEAAALRRRRRKDNAKANKKAHETDLVKVDTAELASQPPEAQQPAGGRGARGVPRERHS